MPPAFNLSQDQTLQFNLKTRRNLSDEILFPRPQSTQRRTSTLIPCEHFSILKASRNTATRQNQSQHPSRQALNTAQAPTPIGCRFLKNDLGRTEESRALYSPKPLGQALAPDKCRTATRCGWNALKSGGSDATCGRSTFGLCNPTSILIGSTAP